MRAARAPIAGLAGLVLVLAGCGSTTAGGHPAGHGGLMGGHVRGYGAPSPACSASASLPGHRVAVEVSDMRMGRMQGGDVLHRMSMTLRAVPAIAAAGPVSFVVANAGWRVHELVVLPLAAGAPAGARVPGPDGTVDETGSLGEAARSCGSGDGDGIAPGAVGWVTLTLPPGRYELLCNLPGHYARGMYQEFDVL